MLVYLVFYCYNKAMSCKCLRDLSSSMLVYNVLPYTESAIIYLSSLMTHAIIIALLVAFPLSARIPHISLLVICLSWSFIVLAHGFKQVSND